MYKVSQFERRRALKFLRNFIEMPDDRRRIAIHRLLARYYLIQSTGNLEWTINGSVLDTPDRRQLIREYIKSLHPVAEKLHTYTEPLPYVARSVPVEDLPPLRPWLRRLFG